MFFPFPCLLQKNLGWSWNISLMASVGNEMAAWHYRLGQLVCRLTQHCPVLLHHKEGPVGANWNVFRRQNLTNNLYLLLSEVIIHCLGWNTSSAEQDCMKKASVQQNLSELAIKRYNLKSQGVLPNTTYTHPCMKPSLSSSYPTAWAAASCEPPGTSRSLVYTHHLLFSVK